MAKSYVRNVARYVDTVAHALGEKVSARETLVPELDRYLDEHEHILTPEGGNLVKNKIAELIKEHHLGNTIRYEKVHEDAYAQTDRDTYQAMEALIHNLCTLSTRSGAQVPFSSVNLGTDTSEEGRMVIRNFLLATDAGLGAGETAIFPISIFRLLDGTNTKKGDPNYDLFQLACRVSARRSFPNFVNIDAPFNYKYYKPGHPETEVGSMGCRTRTISNIYDPEHEQTSGRGNLFFNTINLPYLALLAKEQCGANASSDTVYAKFMEIVDQMIDDCIDLCKERFEIAARRHAYNYPFSFGQYEYVTSAHLGNMST